MAITPGNYTYRQQIQGLTPDEANDGQPLLITSDNVNSTFWSNVNNGGGAIRVCENEDGTNQLPVHVIICDTATETLELKTRKPIYSSASRSLYLFSANNADSQPIPSSTFGSESVYQDSAINALLSESVGTVAEDSAGNRNGTYLGGLPNAGPNFGQLMNGSESANANRVSFGNTALGITAGFTFSAKIRTAIVSATQQIFTGDSSVSGRHWQWRLNANRVEIIVWDAASSIFINAQGTIPISTFTNYLVDFVFTGSRYQTYVNGVLDLDIANATPIKDLNGTADAYVGARESTTTFNAIFNGEIGNLDVIAGDFKTASKIKTEYDNQSTPATFWTQSAPDDPSVTSGVSASISTTALLPTVSASGSATLPQPSASISTTALLPSVSASGSATLPQPEASVSVTSLFPSVTASGSATLPQPDANVSITSLLPIISATGSATQPGFNASVNVTALLPSVSAIGGATLPQPDASVAVTALLPQVSASGSATEPNWSASVNVTALLPSVSVNATATLPAPSATISVTGLLPAVSVTARVSGMEIYVAKNAKLIYDPGSNRDVLEPGSNRITLQPASNRITL